MRIPQIGSTKISSKSLVSTGKGKTECGSHELCVVKYCLLMCLALVLLQRPRTVFLSLWEPLGLAMLIFGVRGLYLDIFALLRQCTLLEIVDVVGLVRQ